MKQLKQDLRVTTAETTTTALERAAEALAITELLEQVLIHVGKTSVKRLATMQRVSKTWEGVIDGSKKLQQMLFLSPAPVTSALTLAQPYHKGKDRKSSLLTDPATSRNNKLIVNINPRIHPVDLSLERNLFWIRMAYRKETSEAWKKSYLTQPPCIRVTLSETLFVPYGRLQQWDWDYTCEFELPIGDDHRHDAGISYNHYFSKLYLTHPDGVTLGMIERGIGESIWATKDFWLLCD